MNNEWKWQIKNGLRRKEQIEDFLCLTEEERKGIEFCETHGLPLLISPYYFSLIDKKDPRDPIRLQCIPSIKESKIESSQYEDPLAEEKYEVAPFLVRRYPDRCLLLSTDRCATYCRHCTRRRRVGRGGIRALSDLEPAFQWLDEHQEIKEVLLSGGDPLIASDEWIFAILEQLRRIDHLEIIRIGTRVPVTLPHRITPNLVRILSDFIPIYVLTHFNHPREVTAHAQEACMNLIRAGVVLANQSVLLKGVNDESQIQIELCRALLRMGVRPYYLMQCDANQGTTHFRVPIEKGIEIITSMRGKVSGLAIPTYVLDLPGGLGKIPLTQNYVQEHRKNLWVFRSSSGEHATYEDFESENYTYNNED